MRPSPPATFTAALSRLQRATAVFSGGGAGFA
jgi:hypothetical protein